MTSLLHESQGGKSYVPKTRVGVQLDQPALPTRALAGLTLHQVSDNECGPPPRESLLPGEIRFYPFDFTHDDVFILIFFF